MRWFKYFTPHSFSSKNGEWVIKNDNLNKTPVVFLPEPLGGRLDEEGRNIYNKNNAALIAAAPEMLETLEYCRTVLNSITILNTKPMVARIDHILKQAKNL